MTEKIVERRAHNRESVWVGLKCLLFAVAGVTVPIVIMFGVVFLAR